MAFPWRSVNPAEFHVDLRRVKRLAKFLDAEYRVFGFPVGWDPLIGLVPVVGDTVSLVLGVYPIMVAHKHDLGWDFKGYMLLNLAVDWAIGLIPFVDVVLDTIYKSNL